MQVIFFNTVEWKLAPFFHLIMKKKLINANELKTVEKFHKILAFFHSIYRSCLPYIGYFK